MTQCFVSILELGLVYGGGIAEALYFVSFGVQNKADFVGRYIFDLFFFIFIKIIFLNMIFAIIVDTFAQMR